MNWRTTLCLAMVVMPVTPLMSSGQTATALQALQSTPSSQQEKNSTRKIRPKPSELAARAGSAIKWRDDVDQAMKEAAESGKKVFWYVPTLAGSFMDRKTEIDRYMMAGPFSWPAIIDLLNENYVPVKAKPNRAQRKTYDLVPYRFVEPGFLILDTEGRQKLKVDRITTMHPQWFQSLVDRHIESGNRSQPNDPSRKPLDAAWAAFRSGHWTAKVPEAQQGDALAAEKLLLAGMMAFRRGEHDKASQHWKRATEMQPDHPLAWKAAAEREGHGPFARGFEVHCEIPDAAMQAGVRSVGSAAPAEVYSEEQLWQRSVDFLLGMQNTKGGFVDSYYDFGGTDSLPNVHTAITALAGMALMDARDRTEGERARRIDDAIRRAADYVNDPSSINLVDRDEILWVHAYRVRFMTRLVQQGDEARSQYAPHLAAAIEDLQKIQMNNGSWYHEYANPFVTATALCALYDAQQAGAAVDEKKIASGLKSLKSGRYNNGAYVYSGRASSPDKPPKSAIAGSAGRMPLCELARWYWKDSSDDNLQAALQAAFLHHDDVLKAVKYDDHTSNYAYGGFFFWYDMRSRTEALHHLPNRDLRLEMASKQRELILSLPELDGCFVDSHELGRCYGTAMALLCLARLDRIQAKSSK